MPPPFGFDWGDAPVVVHSGMHTPLELPQPVQPLEVMQAYPGPQSAEDEHVGIWSQYEFCPQTAVFSVVVKQ